jgi:predicted Zn-dependent peptidase
VGERVMDRGELPDKKEINENIESVTVRDFQEMAAELFHNKNLTLVLIWPLTDKDQKKITKDFEMR